MISSGQCAASASATAVFPTAVGPTSTGTLAPAKPALQLLAGQLHDRRAAVHVVRRQVGGEEPEQQLAHLALRRARSPALTAARQAYVAANRSSRLAQPPNRPRARSATSSRKQAPASNRGCGEGTACSTTARPPNASASNPTRRSCSAWRSTASSSSSVSSSVSGSSSRCAGASAAGELRQHRLVQHPLVRRMLVHDDDARRAPRRRCRCRTSAPAARRSRRSSARPPRPSLRRVGGGEQLVDQLRPARQPTAAVAPAPSRQRPPVAHRAPRPRAHRARDAPPPRPPARRRCGRGSAPRAWRDARSRPRRPGATSMPEVERRPVAGMDGGAVARPRRRARGTDP